LQSNSDLETEIGIRKLKAEISEIENEILGTNS